VTSTRVGRQPTHLFGDPNGVFAQCPAHWRTTSNSARPKYEKAAMRWLERYLSEGSPRLQHFAEITARLVKLDG
jgi:hypothetical protein